MLVGLLWFWLLVIVAAGAGAGALQYLGPPAPPLLKLATTAAPAVMVQPAAVKISTPNPAPVWPVPSTVPSGNPAPDTGLLEPAPEQPGAFLPKIGPDGRTPMRAYAASFDPNDNRPRVALVLAGLGVAEADSRTAIENLPAAVDLAFSPYAVAPARLLQEARARGHEILISVPMEPSGYPLNDPGPHALLVSNTPDVNRRDLDWALARIPDAVGATGALDGMRGERFAASPAAFAAMQDELASRGLLYIDPRPGAAAPTGVPGRSVDVVVDDPPSATAIDAKLSALERIARTRGFAIGLAGPLRLVTVEHLVRWTASLSARGLALVPASALVRLPSPGVTQ